LLRCFGRHAMQRVIMVAVKGALELQHVIAAGEGARQAQPIEGRFRSICE